MIKEPEYRQVEDEPEDDGVVNEGSDAMNWGDGGARVKDEEEEPEEEEEEEDEEEETRDLTDEEEKYLSLPTVTFEEPEEKNYYYQHSATISGGMTEFDLNVTRDARLIDW